MVGKIHSVIKRLQNPHGLKWRQVRKSYHRFPNIGYILQGDMVGKIRKIIRSKYSLNRGCSCSSATNLKGTCAYGGEGRECCVV